MENGSEVSGRCRVMGLAIRMGWGRGVTDFDGRRFVRLEVH